MNRELKSILNIIKGKVACVYKENKKEFNSIKEFIQSDSYKNFEIVSIAAQSDSIILELKYKEPSLSESDREWEKEYEKQFGEPPSFF